MDGHWTVLILKRVLFKGQVQKKGLGLFGENTEMTKYGI